MRENPRRVQKDNGGPLQIKYKDTKINIDVIREQNVFYHWTQGGRTWQAFGGGKNGHETFRQARIYNFRDKSQLWLYGRHSLLDDKNYRPSLSNNH